MWLKVGLSPWWISGSLAYHEVIARPSQDGLHLWDPSEATELRPFGEARVRAVRIVGEESTMRWGAWSLRGDEWVILYDDGTLEPLSSR